MKRYLFSGFFFLLCLLPRFAGGEPILTPSVIDTGGVALLQWRGEVPAHATVRFNGRESSLSLTDAGAFTLLGADLELAPGTYPVSVSGTDAQGKDFVYVHSLEVRSPHRPEERLTLPPEMVRPKEPAVLQRIEREHRMLTDLFAGDSGPPLWGDFRRPVGDPLGSPFGLRRILNGQPRSPHAGVDFRSPRGTPIRAPGRGRAVFAGDLYYTGGTVVLDHGAGLFSLYAHLEEILCADGDLLDQGAILGRVGSTGRSTGAHLHWGFKLRGDRVDPLAVLQLLGGKDLDSLPVEGNN